MPKARPPQLPVMTLFGAGGALSLLVPIHCPNASQPQTAYDCPDQSQRQTHTRPRTQPGIPSNPPTWIAALHRGVLPPNSADQQDDRAINELGGRCERE